MAESDAVEIEQESQAMETQDASPFQGSGRGMARQMRRSSVPSEDMYDMSHGNRGKAIIINNNNFHRRRFVERVGSESDVAALEICFRKLGFSCVTLHSDLTCKQIQELLSAVAREDHRHHDMLACAILTHGEEGMIYGIDGKMEVEKLFAPFKDPACTLMGKPKLFIIQATDQARGNIEADAIGDHSSNMNITPVKCSYRIPTEADFLIAYAPAYGIYSKTRGTRFIRILAEELEQIGDREIMQVMTRVSGRVAEETSAASAGTLQNSSAGVVPCITTMLTKDLYFY